MRPWYFVLAMCLTWVGGVLTATSSCTTFQYLRGDQSAIDRLRESERRATLPWMKVAVQYEEARLRGLAAEHRRAFPLSLAKVLLGVALTLVSGAALAGRKNSRSFAIQAAAAMLLVTLLSYGLQSSVRDAMLQVISEQALPNFGVLPDKTEQQTSVLYRQVFLWAERGRFAAFEVAPLLLALFALTRKRTIAFFEATEAAQATSEQS